MGLRSPRQYRMSDSDLSRWGQNERHQAPSMTGRGNGFSISSVPPVLQRLVSRSVASAQHPCLVVAVDDIQAAMRQGG
jgi:hypothetical protein